MERFHAQFLPFYRLGLAGFASVNETRATTGGGELTLNGPGLGLFGPLGGGAITPSAYVGISNDGNVRGGAGIEGSFLMPPLPALMNLGVSVGSNGSSAVVRTSASIDIPLHLTGSANAFQVYSLSLGYAADIPVNGTATDHQFSIGARLTGIPGF